MTDVVTKSRVVRHIPHASAVVPEDCRHSFLLDDTALRYELLRLTDWFTDEIFRCPISHEVVFEVSRIVVDPERFVDDALEPASKVGMGVCYTHSCDGNRIRTLSSLERAKLISRYYEPHHSKLEKTVDSLAPESSPVLVLDCHSFPTEPLPTEQSSSRVRPDICIGTDPFHTNDDDVTVVLTGLEARGYSVAINMPYAGTLIPTKHYNRTRNVRGLMIEINRSLYMDEATGHKNAHFQKVLSDIQECVIGPLNYHYSTSDDLL